MKHLTFTGFVVLLTGMLASCATLTSVPATATPTPVLPTTAPTSNPPTARPTPVPLTGEMIEPGGTVGDMVLTIGQSERVTEIWEFCDPFVTQPGVMVKECKVPALQSLFIGQGAFAGTTEELDVVWESITWELFLDDQPVSLPAFGTFDRDEDIDGPVKIRMWNVMLEQPTPGRHTLRYICDEYGEPWDMTWTFIVASPATMEIPTDAELLSFVGSSSEFNTLGEFQSQMKSAIESGEVDSFWDAVVTTRQMPLIFGDDTAVFLYRGQAQSVECRGDFMASYLRQGETDIWSLIRHFEPDARTEYRIVLNSSESILDPLNRLTETGGLGTNSVVRMPEYVVPEFALPRDDIAHGMLSENIIISSQILGYDVSYRVYAPATYDTMDGLPAIFVTDGPDYANPGMGAMVNVLDSLIADGRIKPVIAVFVDPRDPISGGNRREQELSPESLDICPFCDFVAGELVPTIDAAFKTNPSPDARAILGFSLGGMFTAHMGLAHADVFHLIAIQSPSITGEWIFDTYQEVDRLPLKVFLSHGTYDEVAASLRLRDILEAKEYPLLYIESHEGHSYGNVRGLLDDVLIHFFGAD